MSLLAKFFNQIKSSQEDIASYGLKYILQNSKLAKGYLKALLYSKTNVAIPDLTYTSQVVKEGLGRTDISGTDSLGNEVVIIEAKFWASLTENQPISYLKRLGPDSVLLFICPAKRKKSLFVEIHRKLIAGMISPIEDNDTFSMIIGTDQHIVVQAWDELLQPIKALLKENKDDRLVSDIDQIIGFCEVIDQNAFIPLSENDLSPEVGRRISSYYQLIDEVLDELSNNSNYKRDKLTEGKPGHGHGFVKYRKYDHLTFAFGLHYTNWKELADTPFWIRVSESDFKQSNDFKSRFDRLASQLRNSVFTTELGEIYYPIYPLLSEDKRSVVKNMTEQIIEVCELMK